MLNLAKILLIGAAGLALAGCSSSLMGAVPPAVAGFVGMKWFMGPPPSTADDEGPRYCYGTIGETDCHYAPVAGEEGRLVGFSGPPPTGYHP